MLPNNLFKNGFDKKESGDINVNSLNSIRLFIGNNFEKQKIINTYKTSYGLKHIVEKMINNYVSNGDFIASMILEGYEYKRDSRLSPNAYFNITKKSITKFELESKK